MSPTKLLTLKKDGSSQKWTLPWSIKTIGIETWFNPEDNFGMGEIGTTSGVYYGTNREPFMVTYPEKGQHLVKIYDRGPDIYKIGFANETNLVSLVINWENPDSQTPGYKYTNGLQVIELKYCKNLRNFVLLNPMKT